jgi:hypothetical protein
MFAVIFSMPELGAGYAKHDGTTPQGKRRRPWTMNLFGLTDDAIGTYLPTLRQPRRLGHAGGRMPLLPRVHWVPQADSTQRQRLLRLLLLWQRTLSFDAVRMRPRLILRD